MHLSINPSLKKRHPLISTSSREARRYCLPAFFFSFLKKKSFQEQKKKVNKQTKCDKISGNFLVLSTFMVISLFILSRCCCLFASLSHMRISREFCRHPRERFSFYFNFLFSIKNEYYFFVLHFSDHLLFCSSRWSPKLLFRPHDSGDHCEPNENSSEKVLYLSLFLLFFLILVICRGKMKQQVGFGLVT